MKYKTVEVYKCSKYHTECVRIRQLFQFQIECSMLVCWFVGLLFCSFVVLLVCWLLIWCLLVMMVSARYDSAQHHSVSYCQWWSLVLCQWCYGQNIMIELYIRSFLKDYCIDSSPTKYKKTQNTKKMNQIKMKKRTKLKNI